MERLSYHPTHVCFDSGWRILFCLAGVVVATANVVPAATDTLRVRREGRALELEATLPAGVTEVELRIVSTRNRPVPKFSDVSPLVPKSVAPRKPGDNETWFPVVDIELTPTMEGVARFESPAGFYAINGWVHREKRLVEPQVVVPAGKLE